ncbi:MAG: type II secretion system protein [Clostridia bacterium]|nr:type II secretion system protein [Clostridia bacterium]
MKRNNKKGFTIVELVVVIAVIAILSAVLIPTFSGVTGKAKEEALKADLKAAYTQYASEKAQNGEDVADIVYIQRGTDLYKVENGNTNDASKEAFPQCKEKVVVIADLAFEVGADNHINTEVDCKCDTCGTVIDESEHIDSAADGVCDVCGAAVPVTGA